MGKNKLGSFILFGALIGAMISLFDYSTRRQVAAKSKRAIGDVGYYAKNPDVLKTKVKEKSEKYQSLYEQFSEDASYFKGKIDELKELSPQVKELVVDTKDAFTEAKDEYKTIVKETPAGEGQGK